MGKTQYTYDYPPVPSPSPQPLAEYRIQTLQPTAQTDNRFSWINTPIVAPDAPSTQTAKRQSTVPPLPVVPEHLHQAFQNQQQALRASTQTQPQSATPQESHRQQMSKQQEAAMYQRSNQNAQQRQYTHTPSPPQPQQQTPPVQYQNLSPRPVQKPDPIKQAPDHPNYRRSIGPDENPLSPTSPLSSKAGLRPHRTNTSISILSPGASNYNFSNYNTTPQSRTGGSWTHSLCSCSEPAICVTGLFCPCILYGRIQHRLNLRAENKDPTNLLGYSSVNGSCMAWSFLCGVNGILSGIQKTRVRRAYGLGPGSGNVFSDCLEGCCCCCCVLAQGEKEIKSREEEGRKDVGHEGYVPPTGMTFAAPPR